MTKASDNAFPSILITEGTEPSAPAAGKQRLYIDSTSHHLMRTNSSGTETDIETASAGIAATIFDAQGDLIVASAADTAARLALGTSGQALVSNGTTAVWGRPKGTPVDFGRAKRTAGDVTLSADAIWAEVDSGLRITIDAASGDIPEFWVSLICTGTEAVSVNWTIMSVVSGTLTNDLWEGAAKSDSTNGVSGWRIAASTVDKAAGMVQGVALQSGDLTTGTLISTLCYRTSSSTNRVVRADTTLPLAWGIKNVGPAI